MENHNTCQFNDDNRDEDHNPKYQLTENSQIQNGKVVIPLREFIELLRNASFDFPSACIQLGITDQNDDEITMHPGYQEMNFLNSLIPDGDEKLIESDFEFDT